MALPLPFALGTSMTIAATTDLTTAARQRWDALVVGAGPAGATAARQLARRGAAVLLIDRAAFPRYKVCGCCLNVRALATLARLGLAQRLADAGAVPLAQVCLAGRGCRAVVPLPGGVALSRETFDAALVEAAIEAGAAFLPETRARLSDVAPTARAVSLRQGGHGEQVKAGVVLAADGLAGTLLAGKPGLQRRATPASRIGAGVIAGDAPALYQPGTIYMACGTDGYVGLVRLEDGRLDVAAAFDTPAVRLCGPGRVAAAVLDEVGWPVPPGLRGLPWRGTPALTRPAGRRAAERVLALGDAAGYVEPFTGEGMAWALAAGVAVAPLAERAASRWTPSLAGEWSAIFRQVVARRQVLCRVVATVLRRPRLTRAVIGVLSAWPALSGPLVRHLNTPAIREKGGRP
jgi:menaquinone-9 beta-reductase